MGEDGDEPLDSLSLYIYISLYIYFLGDPIACNLGLSAASNAEILHFLFETLMRLAVSADPFSLCAIQKVQDALQKLISVQTGPVKTVDQNKLNQCHCPSRVHIFGGLGTMRADSCNSMGDPGRIGLLVLGCKDGGVQVKKVTNQPIMKCFESQASSQICDKIEKPTEENAKTCKDLESARKFTGHCWNKTHATHTFSPVARG